MAYNMTAPVLTLAQRDILSRQDIPMIEWHETLPVRMTIGNGIGKVHGVIEYRIWSKTSKHELSVLHFENFKDAEHTYDVFLDDDTLIYVHFMAVVVSDHFEPSTKGPSAYEIELYGRKVKYDLHEDLIVAEIPVEWLTESQIPRKI